MKVALLQMNSIVGDLEGNANKIISMCHKAKDMGAEVAITPELALCGYPPKDLLLISSFVPACDAALKRISEQIPDGLIVVVGTVQKDVYKQDIYNVAVVLGDPNANPFKASIFPKSLLPTYDVFDERRYFSVVKSNTNIAALDVNNESSICGITICEDIWNDPTFWKANERRYSENPVSDLVERQVDFICNLSASPFAPGKNDLRKQMVCKMSEQYKISFIYVNSVGANDGLIFDGNSFVTDQEGNIICEAKGFEEDICVVDICTSKNKKPKNTIISSVHKTQEREKISLQTSLKYIDDIRSALVLGIKDYFSKIGKTQAVIGLSGGIDSALVAALAVEALGAENVFGLGMPSKYSSDHSITDAEVLAKNLGMTFMLIPITDVFSGYEKQLSPIMQIPTPPGFKDLTEENLQARIRGATLMAYSNHTGAVVLTTGNKSECAIGYCTLYGDTCGGLAVIADLFKLEVYALSRRINDTALLNGKTPPIPESTLTKAPSAELKPGQFDQNELPPYDVLDSILFALIEKELGIQAVYATTGYDYRLVESIAIKVRHNEYKRHQFAPTLRVSNRAWVGREYPIAQRFFK